MSSILDCIRDRVEKKFAEKITIDSIANNVGISSRHFKRRFKNATGDTSTSYLQSLRIEKAKPLIEMTSETFNEIT
ncbi:AraC family transcriptional regulator [Desulfobacterales bacterium HSG16]|nr:AraC family transcriptional regulator [Desulfobacterales bacterium HSG16]